MRGPHDKNPVTHVNAFAIRGRARCNHCRSARRLFVVHFASHPSARQRIRREGPMRNSHRFEPAPQWKDHFVYFFHPGFDGKPRPIILFCHGIGAENPLVYMQLLKHIVSWNYSVLYAPYKKASAIGSSSNAYSMMWSGFNAGMRAWSQNIDTTKIGVIGHSFGGGAVPAFTWKALNEKHWGASGSFMYIMAPWYSYDITQEQLEQFPKPVALIMEVFEDDRTNDPRMAIDIFRSIAIPDSQKDFITLKSDTCEGVPLVADHGVPEGAYPYGWDVNALDYSGVYRLVHALASLTLENDQSARQMPWATAARAALHGELVERQAGQRTQLVRYSPAY